MAVTTRTDRESKSVFITPGADPNDPKAKVLRSSDTMGPAYFAFGVPLKELKIKLAKTRRVVLDMYELPVPNQGIIYVVPFAGFEKKGRKTGAQTGAAPKGQATKTAKGKKGGGAAPADGGTAAPAAGE